MSASFKEQHPNAVGNTQQRRLRLINTTKIRPLQGNGMAAISKLFFWSDRIEKAEESLFLFYPKVSGGIFARSNCCCK